MNTWNLPENISDILPPEARKIEEIRRKLLDYFRLYGYEIVIPPLIEYVESFLVNKKNNKNVDLYIFKLIDQLSGKTLGIRNNIITQTSRIYAHLLNNKSITRLCYFGNILYTKPLNFYSSREIQQIGAVIYGCSNFKANIEIQEIALLALYKIGINKIKLNLSHTEILKSIIKNDKNAKKQEINLSYLLKIKDINGLKKITKNYSVITKNALLALPNLYGGIEILIKAKKILPSTPEIKKALKELYILYKLAGKIETFIDLADFNNYEEYNGIIFSIYTSKLSYPIIKGGEYNKIKNFLGKFKSIIGFTIDLRNLSSLIKNIKKKKVIYAPWSNDSKLIRKINKLRNNGEIVIQDFSYFNNIICEFNYDRIIKFTDGTWKVINL